MPGTEAAIALRTTLLRQTWSSLSLCCYATLVLTSAMLLRQTWYRHSVLDSAAALLSPSSSLVASYAMLLRVAFRLSGTDGYEMSSTEMLCCYEMPAATYAL
eukprot:2305774-Rhodomonas_salina.2